MRPLVWLEAAVWVLLAVALASEALAQQKPVEAPSVVAPAPVVSLPVAVDPPPSPPSPLMTWLERPTAEVFGRHYPQEALDENLGGDVLLDCLVGADGRLACTVRREDPPGHGFGEAALRVAQHYRVSPRASDGTPTSGRRVLRPVRFRTGR